MTPERRLGLPDLGHGVGLRAEHFQDALSALDALPRVDFFEVITENFLGKQGYSRYVLGAVAERCPVVMHGVSLSIGSTHPLDFVYLRALKQLADEIGARWISDHFCWTGVLGQNTHDLLPLPLDEATVRHVIQRVRTVQDVLERPLVLENPSSYLSFTTDTLTECEALAQVAEEAECGLLLDVNNVYVSAHNHGFDPVAYIEALPARRVVQLHLAGHTHCGTHIVDTHDGTVIDEVLALCRLAIDRCGDVSTLVEWDAKLPSFAELCGESERVRRWLHADREDAPEGEPARDGAEPREAAAGGHLPYVGRVEIA